MLFILFLALADKRSLVVSVQTIESEIRDSDENRRQRSRRHTSDKPIQFRVVFPPNFIRESESKRNLSEYKIRTLRRVLVPTKCEMQNPRVYTTPHLREMDLDRTMCQR